MARIFIDVHPDGTFTTGTYHGDPVAHAANQDDGVVTYMTADVGEVECFAECYSRFTNGCGHFVRGKFLVGAWNQWGAFCINKWGGWFERVEGFKRRMRLPTDSEKIDDRILHALRHGSPVGIGILKNRFRKEPPSQIHYRLASLVKSGVVIEERFRHSITSVETTRYRLAQTSLTPP